MRVWRGRGGLIGITCFSWGCLGKNPFHLFFARLRNDWVKIFQKISCAKLAPSYSVRPSEGGGLRRNIFSAGSIFAGLKAKFS